MKMQMAAAKKAITTLAQDAGFTPYTEASKAGFTVQLYSRFNQTYAVRFYAGRMLRAEQKAAKEAARFAEVATLAGYTATQHGDQVVLDSGE